MRHSLYKLLVSPLPLGLVCTILFAIWARMRSPITEKTISALSMARLPGLNADVAVKDGDLESIILNLRSGKLSSEALTKTYIARISQIDCIVNAVAQLNPDAVATAIQLDEELKLGRIRGKLHGVPVLIKDTFNTLDKMGTTAGSFALKGARPSEEATVVARLREAGAVILGKTTLTTWSNTRSTYTPNGWSPLYGQTYAAFHGKQDPQGSSTGCAVGASLGFASATVGAETWGSIIFPAQRNSVVGLKPTVGLVSRAGVVPVSEHKDSIGPITRTVKDAAIILDVLAGPDDSDPATTSIDLYHVPNYVAACRLDALKNAKIAISPSAVKSVEDPEVVTSFETALTSMSSAGATITRDKDFDTWKPGSDQRENLTFNVLLKAGIESYFNQLAENPHEIYTMEELVKFLENTKGEETEKFGIDMFTAARDEKHDKNSPEFLEGIKTMKHLGADIERLLDNTGCDVLAMPTSADVPYDLGQNPVISVPLGFYSPDRQHSRGRNGMIAKGNNIPYSISFVGRKFSEEMLIGIAYAFEQMSQVELHGQPCIRSTVAFPVLGSVENAHL